MGREFELKYAADPSSLSALKDRFHQLRPISMETAYYDTPGGDLSGLRWTLRCRLENGRPVCTLKTPLSDGSRGEWETPCGSIENAIPSLIRLGAPEQLAALAKHGLVRVCAARFTRLAAPMEVEGATVELALDEGLLLGGGRTLPFREVEVELKSGSEDAAAAFARDIAAEFGLSPEPKSKYRRALELTRDP